MTLLGPTAKSPMQLAHGSMRSEYNGVSYDSFMLVDKSEGLWWSSRALVPKLPMLEELWESSSGHWDKSWNITRCVTCSFALHTRSIWRGSTRTWAPGSADSMLLYIWKILILVIRIMLSITLLFSTITIIAAETNRQVHVSIFCNVAIKLVSGAMAAWILCQKATLGNEEAVLLNARTEMKVVSMLVGLYLLIADEICHDLNIIMVEEVHHTLRKLRKRHG